MGSINATILARKIVEKRSNNELVNLGELMLQVGYSPNTAIKPSQVMKTQAFKNALALESIPIITGMKAEMNRIKIAMMKKDLDKEEYKTLASTLDILNKNAQLLSGGSTANVAIKVAISEHIAGKYDDVSPDNGSVEP